MRLIAFGILLAVAAPSWAQQTFERRVEAGTTASGDVLHWTAEAVGPSDTVTLHGPGIRFEGPPKTGAPYSAEAVTESVQALSDGNRIARENRAKVYRDSQGRTRREEKLDSIGPWAVAGESQTRIFINDPVAGLHWVLDPENKVAHKMEMPKMGERMAFGAGAVAMAGPAAGVAAGEPAGVIAAVRAETFEAAVPHRRPLQVAQLARVGPHGDQEPPQVEDLGSRVIEGVDAKGTKITRTIPAGQIGNERPIEVVFEQWRSEELGVEVLTRRSDPRSAQTTYKLVNIQRTEPLPGLFEPPPDYAVQEPGPMMMRKIERE